MASPSSVYWVGSNGHTYVVNSGVAGDNGGGAVDYGVLPGGSNIAGATLIQDPNAPSTVQAPANPNNNAGSGSGSAAAALPDKSNDIALQNSGLNSIDAADTASKATTATTLANILGGYNADGTAATTSYNTNSTQNQSNLQKNKQTAEVNAAQGRQGLFSTLASLGALNGDGITLANNAVQKGANEDLNGAENTYGTNQTSLDTGIATFNADNKKRIDAANTAANANNVASDNSAAASKQTAYKALADDYSAEGDSANAQKYTSLAQSLFPQIAATTAPPTALVADNSVAYTPASLASYIAGSNPTNVSTTPGNGASGVPGLVTDPTKKKAVATPVATASA